MKRRTGWAVLAAMAFAVFLAGWLSPFASSLPDGLEKVAQDKGFIEKGGGRPFWRGALMPDYAVPGVRDGAVATGVAGAAGTILVFGVGYVLMKLRLVCGRRADHGRRE